MTKRPYMYIQNLKALSFVHWQPMCFCCLSMNNLIDLHTSSINNNTYIQNQTDFVSKRIDFYTYNIEDERFSQLYAWISKFLIKTISNSYTTYTQTHTQIHAQYYTVRINEIIHETHFRIALPAGIWWVGRLEKKKYYRLISLFLNADYSHFLYFPNQKANEESSAYVSSLKALLL